MSSTTMLIAIAVAVFVVLPLFINRWTRARQAERAEEYRKAAWMRGWQLEVAGDEYVYSGTTDGIPWTARVSPTRRGEQGRPLRWQTTAVRFDHGALVIWPNFGDGFEALNTPGVPQFMLTMAMRGVAALLDVPASDAEVLAGANEPVPGPDGFLFRAADSDRMKAWLTNGAARVLESETWLADRSKPRHLVVALLWRHGLQLVTPGAEHDLEQVGRVARAGAGSARAAR